MIKTELRDVPRADVHGVEIEVIVEVIVEYQ